jgi:hypothetical protein
MMRKMIWTALVTLLSAASAALAVRVADRLWRGVTHEPPPAVPRWARLLVGRPVKHRVAGRVAGLSI